MNTERLGLENEYFRVDHLISESAEFLYKMTDYWYPEHERSLLWCDPTVCVQWPVSGGPKLANKDAAGKVFAEAEYFD